MTGGFAYILDEERTFVDQYNHELIDIHRIVAEHMEAHQHYLKALIEEFVAATGSSWGQTVLDDWRDFLGRFWLVKPKALELTELFNTVKAAA